MNFHLRRYLGVVGIGYFLALVVPMATADSVPPVQIQVKELPSGAFDVQWRVPKVIPPQAMPSPRLPEHCRPDGERTFVDGPAAWLTRQVYLCTDGLAGQSLGIRFPTYNLVVSTLLRVDFLSGDRYAHMLNPGEDSWQVPEASAGGLSNFLSEARGAIIEGADHFASNGVHLAFLLALCLLGGAKLAIRLATAFLSGQMVAVVFSVLIGIQLEAPLAEIGIAIAAALLAREALRPSDDRKQLTAVAACAGLVHGLGIPNLVAQPALDGGPSVLFFLLVVLGMDAALLISAMVVSGLGHLVPSRLASPPIYTAAVYGIAGLSFALAISASVNGPTVAAKDSERKLELPSGPSSPGGAAPGSRRVAASTPDAALQSFLAIEAFEVRLEILVRPKDVVDLLGLGSDPHIAVENQSVVKERARELVLERMAFQIDGETPEPISERIDFVTFDTQGALPRPTPVPELVGAAWIGVTAVYLTKAPAREVTLTWQRFDAATEIPATVTDPESSRTTMLTADEPVLRWENELAEDPVPTVAAIAVEPPTFPLPLWSLLPLATALFFSVAALRGRRPAFSFAFVRVMLALAVFVGPLGNVVIALPASVGAAPNAGQAKRILAGLLPNMYRAFEFREESAVYDRLALSVTGETLTEVYLDHRRVLEMEERGGARARVEAVEVIGIDSVEPEISGGFTCDATWTVGGTVTHFGHRHFRQNRFDARVLVVPEENTWKIRSIEVLGEERLR